MTLRDSDKEGNILPLSTNRFQELRKPGVNGLDSLLLLGSRRPLFSECSTRLPEPRHQFPHVLPQRVDTPVLTRVPNVYVHLVFLLF